MYRWLASQAPPPHLCWEVRRRLPGGLAAQAQSVDMTGLLSRDVDVNRSLGALLDDGTEREELMGLGATSTIILLIFAGQWTCPPERHEVNASGASSV